MNLQTILGIKLPIIQAPMAGVQGSALAVAVSEAGGLGSLPCAMLGPEAMREELIAIRSRTDRPFNVNFFCHTPPARSAEREATWRAALAPYYEELGLDDGLQDADPHIVQGRPRTSLSNPSRFFDVPSASMPSSSAGRSKRFTQ